jgi:hypothetical protein
MRIFVAIVLGICFACCAKAASAQPPLVLYTDIASGPNSGGENNNGAYLSIFGRNFGSGGLGTTTKVTIGGKEVAVYRSLGTSKSRSDIQQITVQIGALSGITLGTAQPVRVTVNGVASNADVTFVVNPGRILYVDNVLGSDTTGAPDDITKPFRHVQMSDTSKAAFGAAQPGDIVVMRGTGTAWTDSGNDTYFVKFINKDGSAPTGSSGTGPLTLMGYPGEDVFIDFPGTAHKGAISGIDTTGGFTGGHYVTIADLRIESGGNAGPIAVQIAGDHWRIVNNELSAATATNTAKAAGINGNATNAFWFGNHIHDIAGGSAQENHGIYIDGDGSYDIAYNTIEHVTGGNGFQIFVNGGNGSDFGNHVHFHHNVVHDVSKHGLNVADGAQNDIALSNNVIYNTAYSGLRFNTNTLHGARIDNNTFYNCDTAGTFGGYAAISNDWNFPSDALDLRNNIVVPASGKPYTGGSVGIDSGIGTISNNLWSGGGGDVSFDTNPVLAQPRFVNAAQADFHLLANSPAINAGSAGVAGWVVDDYDNNARPGGTGYDIGAFEFVTDVIFADAFE